MDDKDTRFSHNPDIQEDENRPMGYFDSDDDDEGFEDFEDIEALESSDILKPTRTPSYYHWSKTDLIADATNPKGLSPEELAAEQAAERAAKKAKDEAAAAFREGIAAELRRKNQEAEAAAKAQAEAQAKAESTEGDSAPSTPSSSESSGAGADSAEAATESTVTADITVSAESKDTSSTASSPEASEPEATAESSAEPDSAQPEAKNESDAAPLLDADTEEPKAEEATAEQAEAESTPESVEKPKAPKKTRAKKSTSSKKQKAAVKSEESASDAALGGSLLSGVEEAAEDKAPDDSQAESALEAKADASQASAASEAAPDDAVVKSEESAPEATSEGSLLSGVENATEDKTPADSQAESAVESKVDAPEVYADSEAAQTNDAVKSEEAISEATPESSLLSGVEEATEGEAPAEAQSESAADAEADVPEGSADSESAQAEEAVTSDDVAPEAIPEGTEDEASNEAQSEAAVDAEADTGVPVDSKDSKDSAAAQGEEPTEAFSDATEVQSDVDESLSLGALGGGSAATAAGAGAGAPSRAPATTQGLVDEDAEFDPFAPLAARLRPRNVDEYIGQTHLLALGKPLRQALEHGRCYSMIFWGPPGVGKTTLAFMIARSTHAYLEQISAVAAGIKDVREAIARAEERKRHGIRTILFVDEVHRFNKAQQDAFLPYIENGTVIFIGATTENPSFQVNPALLSRARVFVLKPLSAEELSRLLDWALNSPRGLKKERIVFDDKVRQALIELADGDARHLLTTLEMLSDEAAPLQNGQKIITYAMVGAVAGRRLIKYDKGGDAFYDLISALHKSVRGSSPDAALYWYARILEAGGDPLYVARRILAIATEDVGLADPQAMQIALNAWDIYNRVGAAEGERAIGEALVYMALAPKSNHLYKAFNQARKDAATLPSFDVPLYLRNAPTKLMESLGYHKGYRYAHDYPESYAAGECFMPEEMDGRVYYEPSNRGYEAYLQRMQAYLQQRDANASAQERRYPQGHAQEMMKNLQHYNPELFESQQLSSETSESAAERSDSRALGAAPAAQDAPAPQSGTSYGPQEGPDYGSQGGSEYAPQGGPDYGPQDGSDYAQQGYAPQDGPDYGSQGGEGYGHQDSPDYASQSSDYAPQGGYGYGPQGGPDYDPQGY